MAQHTFLVNLSTSSRPFLTPTTHPPSPNPSPQHTHLTQPPPTRTCLQVRAGLFPNGRLNADAVGQTAIKLAKMFGLTVPPWTKVLIGEVSFPLLVQSVRFLQCSCALCRGGSSMLFRA